jgi:hypothetical protein
MPPRNAALNYPFVEPILTSHAVSGSAGPDNLAEDAKSLRTL